MGNKVGFVFIASFLCVVVFAFTVLWSDSKVSTANLAQQICIQANTKAVSFDVLDVTCENGAVIPLRSNNAKTN